MEIPILLVLGFFLVTFGKPSNPNNYRLAILSILGVGYFFIWKYFNFYIRINDVPEEFNLLATGLLAVYVVVFVFLARQFHENNIFVVIMLVYFGLFATASFLVDRQIKHQISLSSGYFEDDISKYFRDVSISEETVIFDHKSGGFKIQVPTTWEGMKHASGQWYYKKGLGGSKYAELRPRCFHGSDLSLAEIVNNDILASTTQGRNASKYCSSNKQMYECLTISRGKAEDQNAEYWRWYLINEVNRQSVEVDFIFDGAGLNEIEEAKVILNSIEFYVLPQPLPFCISTADWF